MDSHTTSCSNCGADLMGEFCHRCGQKRFVESDRRLGHLLHQFVASATDLDGRVWRTLRALMFRPGLLSREYFEGRRARWISPVSLFLTVSVVYFVAPLHGGDLTLQFVQQVPGNIRMLARRPDDPMTEAQLNATGQAHSAFTARWIEQRVHDRDAAERKASNGASGYSFQDMRTAYDAKADDVSKALVILHVPFAAAALAVLFARKRYYFAEHFVFALHFFAFLLIMLQIVSQVRSFGLFAIPAPWTPPESIYNGFMRVLIPVYAVLGVHRAYRAGWVRSVVCGTAMLAVVLAANLYLYRAIQFVVTILLI